MLRWLHFAVPSLMLLVGTALRVIDPPVLTDLRFSIFDAYQQIKPRDYVDLPVRIIDVDDSSLKRLGQWPWPRVILARIVDRLTRAGVAVVAFNTLFAEPDRTSPANLLAMWPTNSKVQQAREAIMALPDHDQQLVRAMNDGPVVTGFVLTNGADGRDPSLKAGFAYAGDDPKEFVPRYSGSVTNLRDIEAAAKGNGSMNLSPERDGVVRRIPLLASYNGRLYPTLVAEALRVAQGASTYIVKSSAASGELSFGEKTGVVSVKIGRFVVATDSTGQVWLYQTGIVPQRRISAWRVLADDFDPKTVEGKIVFVGASAAGLGDYWATPLEPAVPGSEIYAGLVEQILLGEFLRRPDWADGAEIILILILGGLLVFLYAQLGPTGSTLLGVGAIAFAFVGCWLAFDTQKLLFAPLYPSLVVLLVHISAVSIGYWRKESERRSVRTAFSRYLSPVLVDRLAKYPQQLRLGGEMREVTVLFCDIRDFTSLTERMDAESLTSLINRFMTPMTEVIQAHGGTIDKYMGDALMAFWNAPLEDRDHARHACGAALEMGRRLEELNDEMLREAERKNHNHIPIRIGIGISTGICCVGNMGSKQRFDYSLLGDDVNVASRLDGQTKTFGISPIVSESTVFQAPEFATIELDLVRLKGKKNPLHVFTLLGDAEHQQHPEFLRHQDLHRDMLEAYRRREWERVRTLIAECRPLDPKLARVYDVYEERLESMALDPPDADWDAVHVAEEK